jgi:hypothetical protein
MKNQSKKHNQKQGVCHVSSKYQWKQPQKMIENNDEF